MTGTASSEHRRSPMRALTDTIVKRPFAVGGVFFLVPILISIIGVFAFPIEISTSGGAWYPRNSDAGRREDGLLRAEEETLFNPSDGNKAGIVTDQQESSARSIVLYFWTEGGRNMLDTEGLAKMREVEKYVFNRNGFSQYCLRADDSTDCLEADSITQYVYSTPITSCNGTYRIPNGNATSQAGSNVPALLEPILNASVPEVYCSGCGTGCEGQGRDALNDYVVTTFTPENMMSFATKSTIRFGLPIAGYSNAYDRRDEQLDKIDGWILGMYPDLMEDGFSSDGYTVRALSEPLVEEHFDRILAKDVVWVTLSIALVGIFVAYHTGSPFLTSFGMIHILLSFPVAYFFVQAFLDAGALSFLSFLTIFIILGIGADDIFILLDAWKQSANVFPNLHDEPTYDERQSYYAERLYWTYERAAGAMLVTSTTTSAAFLMNLVSSVIPIQVFGVQTAFMVLTNYIMVVTYYPAMLMIWEWYNVKSWCGFVGRGWRKLRGQTTDPTTTSPTPSRENSKTVTSPTLAVNNPTVMPPPPAYSIKPEKTASDTHAVDNIDDYRWLERFLHNTWGPAVYKYRYAFLSGFAVWVVITAVFTAQIEVSQDPAKFIPDSDPLQQVLDLEADRFDATFNVVQVSVLSGIGEVDRSGANPYDVDDIGEPQFVSNFDLSSPAAQQAYIDNCETMATWDYVLQNVAANASGIICPMMDFRDYVESTLNRSFPVPADEFIDLLVNYTSFVEAEEGPGLDASLFNNIDDRQSRRGDLVSVQELIRFRRDSIDPPRLAYMLTVINTTIEPQASATQIEPVFDYFESKIGELKTTPGYQTTFQTSQAYQNMRLEQGLLNDATFSIGISLFLTLVIVCVSTKDIRLSLMSTLTIGLIVMTMIANIVWLGWKISVIESICLTVLVGLSVDYTIHLANAWQTNTWTSSRLQRVKATLLEIGISVLAAASTTFLSAVPLLLTIIIFFYKFGVFIMLSVLWSSVFAFGGFMTLMAIVGPVSNRNDFYWLYLRARGKDTSPAYFADDDTLPHAKPATTGVDTTHARVIALQL